MHSDTRIKPLPLTNGHGQHITVAPERALVPVGGWLSHETGHETAVSLLKPPCGGLRSEAAPGIQKCLKLKISVGI
jgi:hypothetical protein